jgi:hypothetical protein
MNENKHNKHNNEEDRPMMSVIILLSSFNNPIVHNEGYDKTCLLQANHKEISSSEVY